MSENDLTAKRLSETEVMAMKPILENLVVGGYGFPIDQKDSQFEYEYLANQNLEIFGAFFDKNVVGTLVLEPKSLFEGVKTYRIHGIVRFPEYPNKNIGAFLYSHAIDELGISLLIGLTKSPGAVLARFNGCKPKKMETFFGDYQIGENGILQTGANINVLDVYLKSITDDKSGFAVMINPDFLPSNEVKNIPQSLLPIFSLLNSIQMKIGSQKTVVFPLISVKEDLL